MSEPTLSVLIPTHDRPRLLREAIESVRADTSWSDWEIIVSDDSPVATAAVVVEALGDPRIHYRRNPGPGTKAGNWDCAARAAQGRYLFKLDDDDRILPGFMRACVALLEKRPGVAAVYTGHRIVHVGSGKTESMIDRGFFGSGWPVPGENYWRAVLVNEGGYPLNQKTAGVYRRSAAERLDHFRYASEDFAFSAALGLCGQIAYIPRLLYEWRIQESSGVKNLERTWLLSDAACAGLLRLPQEVVPPASKAEWERCVTTARRALPVFYLKAAFGVSRPEGWRFWRTLRHPSVPWRARRKVSAHH